MVSAWQPWAFHRPSVCGKQGRGGECEGCARDNGNAGRLAAGQGWRGGGKEAEGKKKVV